MSRTVAIPTARSIERARPRASLAVAMFGFFVVALDAQIVNVAPPHIRAELGGGLSGLQRVVTGYTLMFAWTAGAFDGSKAAAPFDRARWSQSLAATSVRG